MNHTAITRHRLTLAVVFAVAVLAAFQLAGAPLVSPEVLAGVGLIPFAGIGDITITDIHQGQVKMAELFEEFKKKNEQLLKDKAEGKAVADLTGTVEKINQAITDVTKQMVEVEKKAARAAVGAGSSGGPEPQELVDYKAAFNRYLRKGDTSNLEALQRKAVEVKAINSLSDPDGGYLILPEMEAGIDRVVPTISAMFRLARVINIGTSRYEKLVKTGGFAMRRVAEGQTGGETTGASWAKITIDAYPAEVEPWVYNETLEDSILNLEMDIADEAAIGFGEGAGSEFISGNGVGKARGILAYSNVANSAYAWGSVGYIASGKSAAFASVAPADKLVNLQHALKQQYRPGAVWLMNDTTLGVARQMKDGSGSYYLWNPDATAGFGGRFLGSPVEVDDNMPAIGAGSYSVAYGNFQRGYLVANRKGTALIRDNITSKGTTKFNFRRRFGGGIVNYEAIKLMKFATS